MKPIVSMFAVIALLACTFPPAGFAEDDQAPRTLFTDTELNFSGYGGPLIRLTTFDGDLGVLIGGRGGVIINNSLVIGGGGYGLVYSDASAKFDGTERRIGIAYGGLMMEYYFFPKNLILFSLGGLIGAGDIGDGLDHFDDDDTLFFVAEPEANVYVNVTRYFRLGAGVSYRFSNGIDLDGFTDADFRGFSGSLLFNFGWF